MPAQTRKIHTDRAMREIKEAYDVLLVSGKTAWDRQRLVLQTLKEDGPGPVRNDKAYKWDVILKTPVDMVSMAAYLEKELDCPAERECADGVSLYMMFNHTVGQHPMAVVFNWHHDPLKTQHDLKDFLEAGMMVNRGEAFSVHYKKATVDYCVTEMMTLITGTALIPVSTRSCRITGSPLLS